MKRAKQFVVEHWPHLWRAARILFPTLALALMLGCVKNPAATVPPGAINATDAYAFRVVSDSQAAIRVVKAWEVCSDQNFPASVTFDNYTATCNASAGKFPASARSYLYTAEQAYNVALAAGQAYHSGASSDAAGLTAAIAQLSQAVAAMLSNTLKAN